MTFDEVLQMAPELQQYTAFMPEQIRRNFTIKVFPPHTLIHQKDTRLERFGIVLRGEHRVINEFENGNIFMIERNKAISFIGEVTLLAGQVNTSVTIESITECVVLFISLNDFEEWIRRDIAFLRLLSQKISLKLYHTSYNRGERLYYSANYLLLKYIIDYTTQEGIHHKKKLIIQKTRHQLHEEVGMTIKTLNRTINRLEKDGIVTVEKGKITITPTQYQAAIAKSDIYMQQNKKGMHIT